jgi:hypothetical protein
MPQGVEAGQPSDETVHSLATQQGSDRCSAQNSISVVEAFDKMYLEMSEEGGLDHVVPSKDCRSCRVFVKYS